MSATPRPWDLEPDAMIIGTGGHPAGHGSIVYWAGDVEDCQELHAIDREDLELIVRAVNAFDALLAVAKAAEDHHNDSRACLLSQCAVSRAIAALDAAHPTWRTWLAEAPHG